MAPEASRAAESRHISTHRIAGLDSLRSLVLLILLFHFLSPWASRGWIEAGLTGLWFAGITSLDVFFVLSGFLITGILLDSKGADGFFRTFYIRRFFRIFPLYYGFLLLYFVVLPKLTSWSELQVGPWRQAWYWTYQSNIPFGLGLQRAPNLDHFWTLAIEEQFYLVWPFIVFKLNLRQLKLVCLACLALSPLLRIAAFYAWPKTFMFGVILPARTDVFALGALIALAWRDVTSDGEAFNRRVRNWAVAGGVVLAGALVLRHFTGGRPWPGNAFHLLLYAMASPYVAAGVLVATLGATGNGLWKRITSNRVLTAIGTYSYAIYVLHLPLAYLLNRAGVLRGLSPNDSWMRATWYCLAMIALSCGLGAMSWNFFEKPLLKLRPAFRPSPERSALT